MSEGLKAFALRTYDADGVREALLDLQDEAGCDVTLVFWCLWLASQGRAAGADLDTALAWSRSWGAGVTAALRTARRAAKPLAGDDPAIAALRARIQKAEIDSEIVTLDRLEAAAPGRPDAGDFETLAAANLDAYARKAGLTVSFETVISRISPAVEK